MQVYDDATRSRVIEGLKSEYLNTDLYSFDDGYKQRNSDPNYAKLIHYLRQSTLFCWLLFLKFLIEIIIGAKITYFIGYNEQYLEGVGDEAIDKKEENVTEISQADNDYFDAKETFDVSNLEIENMQLDTEIVNEQEQEPDDFVQQCQVDNLEFDDKECVVYEIKETEDTVAIPVQIDEETLNEPFDMQNLELELDIDKTYSNSIGDEEVADETNDDVSQTDSFESPNNNNINVEQKIEIEENINISVETPRDTFVKNFQGCKLIFCILKLFFLIFFFDFL